MNLIPRNQFGRRIIAVAIALAGTIAVAQGNCNAADLSVQFRRNATITVEFGETKIDWVSVGTDGSMVEQDVSISDIKSLFLSNSKSSDLLARVRRDIVQLGDPSFKVREAAESNLEKTGAPFKNLLQRYADHPALEVRHRVGRLLQKFVRSNATPIELDRLELVTGQILEGEAQNFGIEGIYRGTTIELNRDRVRELRRPSTTSAIRKNEAANVQLFHQHGPFFEPEQQELQFETRTNGAPFNDRANIEQAFVDQGVIFDNVEERGYVGVSVFSFKYEDLPVGGRSVCLYNSDRSKRQFQGVMEIRFCAPGDPDRPAGVHQAGLFIARVKHSRDIVLEAYNARGDVLATVEATDQQCVFAGVKSNELITRVRVFSNPWLGKLKRKIDVDYAIDTLRFSKPVAIDSSVGVNTRSVVSLKNGDRINVRSISILPDEELRVRVFGITKKNSEFIFKLNEIASMQFSRPSKANRDWQAMLGDGSIVSVSTGKQLRSELLSREFDLPDVIGLWPPGLPARYPIGGDLNGGGGGALVVFPTCRIRSSPPIASADKIAWKVAEKLQQELVFGRENPDLQENQEDPTPAETSYRWDEAEADDSTEGEQTPTVWNSMPAAGLPRPGQGAVELTDGQRLVFGVDAAHRFVSIDSRELVLKDIDRDGTTNIPMMNVRAIVFPQKDQP